MIMINVFRKMQTLFGFIIESLATFYWLSKMNLALVAGQHSETQQMNSIKILKPNFNILFIEVFKLGKFAVWPFFPPLLRLDGPVPLDKLFAWQIISWEILIIFLKLCHCCCHRHRRRLETTLNPHYQQLHP